MLRFRRAFAVASLVCAPAPLLAQARFEGVITARMMSMQNGADVIYSLKGDQFRMDMSGRGMAMYTLHDASKSSTLMVMPAQRMYMEMSQMAADAPGEHKMPDMKWTGKTETVAGHECEHLLITGDDGQYDVCAVKGMGTFMATSSPMGGRGGAAQEAWQKLGRDVFPLKVQKVGGGVTFEVTSIQKKSLDDALFKVPDGFQKMDMGGMGRMGRPPL